MPKSVWQFKLSHLLYLFLLVLSTPLFAVDTDHDGLPDDWEIANGRDPLVADYQLATNGWRYCAIDDSGVSCPPYFSVPNLFNPTHLALGDNLGCVIDDSEVICWNLTSGALKPIPTLNNPKHLSIGHRFWKNRICVIDDSGLVCWEDDGEIIETPNLINPVFVSMNFHYTCAIDDTGLVCWRRGSIPLNIPDLIKPTSVFLQSGDTFFSPCAIDDSGLVCWAGTYVSDNDWPDSHRIIGIPNLSNPRMISGYGGVYCATDDTGAVCWISPSLQRDYPIILVPFGDECSLDNNKLICKTPSPKQPQSTCPGLHERLTLPASMVPGIGEITCQTGEDGEVCWTDFYGLGAQLKFMMKNTEATAQIMSYENGICALGNRGLICWGGTHGWEGENQALSIDPDGDGFSRELDAFPFDSTEWSDTDSDGIGNNADSDDDNDGSIDSSDAFPLDSSEQADDDGDGVGNNSDAFPLDQSESLDTDLDEIGNNLDDDDDGDGISDQQEIDSGSNPLSSDSDGDGLSDSWEFFLWH